MDSLQVAADSQTVQAVAVIIQGILLLIGAIISTPRKAKK